MPLSVIHVGLGPLGRKVLADNAERGLFDIVAAVDTAPELAGKTLADIIPGADRAVRIASSLDALPSDLKADAAIVTTRSDLPACDATFRTLLGRGLAVVSTCEELLWPALRHPALADDLDRACKAQGGRLLGTGVNPGFLMDTLPAVLSTACARVDRVRIERVQDATTRRKPFQKKIGATLDADAFRAGIEAGWLRHVGLAESLCFACHCLGLPIEDWSETIEPVLAERDLSCDLGPIPAGHAAGVRQVAEAKAGGQTVATLEFIAAIAQPDPRDAVRIEGKPDLDMVIRGGVHGDVATSAVTLNCLPALVDSAPGLHTMATIRTPHFVRAAR